MRRAFFILACVLALTVPMSAQFRYVAFEQITVAATAIGFTSATISAGNGHIQANSASCRNETAQIRFTIDGTTPTTTVGTLLEIGDSFILSSPDLLQNFKAIRTGSTSAKLSCSYFGS